MKVRVFDGTYIAKVVKVKFELEFYVDDENVQVKQMIKREDS